MTDLTRSEIDDLAAKLPAFTSMTVRVETIAALSAMALRAIDAEAALTGMEARAIAAEQECDRVKARWR